MNSKKVGIRIIVSALAALVLILGTAGIGAAGPSPVSEVKADGVRTGIHPETGMLAFVGAEPSAPIGVAGAVGVILVRDRRAEERHDAVAGELVDEAFEALYAFGEDREEAGHNARERFGVEALRQLHRTLHIGEEDGDLLALPLHRRLRLADFVGEVYWGFADGR